MNKENTCYANSIFHVVPNLSYRVPSGSNTVLPKLQATSFNMPVKKNSTEPIDPSNF